MSLSTTLRHIWYRGFIGCNPDPPDRRDRHVAQLELASDIPTECNLDPGQAPKRQGPTNSCTGQAVAGAAYIAYHLLGFPSVELSGLFPYYNGRREHDTKVTDTGAYIRSVIKSAVRFGLSTEQAWPQSKGVNRQPYWSAYRTAFQHRGFRGYYRIDRGDTVAIRRAIAAGKPVVSGWEVNREFTRSTGDEIVDVITGAIIGRHAMAIVRYYSDDSFGLLNSWGSGWRQNGRQRVTEAFVAEGNDSWVIDVQR